MKSVYTYVKTTAICTHCGTEVYCRGICTQKTMVSLLRKAGWSVGKEKLLCPNCRRKRK